MPAQLPSPSVLNASFPSSPTPHPTPDSITCFHHDPPLPSKPTAALAAGTSSSPRSPPPISPAPLRVTSQRGACKWQEDHHPAVPAAPLSFSPLSPVHPSSSSTPSLLPTGTPSPPLPGSIFLSSPSQLLSKTLRVHSAQDPPPLCPGDPAQLQTPSHSQAFLLQTPAPFPNPHSSGYPPAPLSTHHSPGPGGVGVCVCMRVYARAEGFVSVPGSAVCSSRCPWTVGGPSLQQWKWKCFPLGIWPLFPLKPLMHCSITCTWGSGGFLAHLPLHSCARLPSETWAWACLWPPPVYEGTTCSCVHGWCLPRCLQGNETLPS